MCICAFKNFPRTPSTRGEGYWEQEGEGAGKAREGKREKRRRGWKERGAERVEPSTLQDPRSATGTQ